MNNNYPINVLSIDNLDDWTKSFFWPTNHYLLLDITNDVKKILYKLLNDEKDLLYKKIISIQAKKIILYYSSYLFYSIFSDRIQNKNFILFNYNELSKELYRLGFASDIFNNNLISNFNFGKLYLNNTYLENFKKFLINNIYSFQNIYKRNNINFAYNANRICKVYSSNKGYKQKHVLQYFFNKNQLEELTKKETIGLQSITEKLKKNISELFFKYEVKSSKKNDEFLFEIFTNEFYHSLRLLKRLVSIMPNNLNMYIGTGGIIINKFVSESVRINGGKVSAFSHGGGIGNYKKVNHVYSEFNNVDYYYCNRVKEKNLLSKFVMKNKPTNDPSYICNFKTHNISHEIFLNKSDSHKNRNKLIKNIMYIPDAYRGEINNVYELPDLVRLDWEKHLFSIFKNLKYNFIYKKHIKGLKFNNRIFNFYDHIETKALDEVIGNADLLICDTLCSSSLHRCVFTNKPIVLINNNIIPIHSESKKYLELRVAIVDSFFDEKNRMRINSKDLDNAIDRSIDLTDNTFAEEYAFPI